MNIIAKDLGWRESYRLTQFVQMLLNDYPKDCIDSTLGYSLHYDEPYIDINCFTRLYATDYDIAFDSSDNGYYI